MEARIQALPEVKEATITFTTNQLQVVTEGDKDLLEEFQKICAAIESEVIVKRKVSVNKKEGAGTAGKEKRTDTGTHRNCSRSGIVSCGNFVEGQIRIIFYHLICEFLFDAWMGDSAYCGKKYL